MDFEDRVQERQVSAWQLISIVLPGNSGKIDALEYLNEEDGIFCYEFLRGWLGWIRERPETSKCLIQLKSQIPLVNINLSSSDLATGVYLKNIDLPYARLISSDLSNATLEGANLRHANLTDAILRGAILDDAHLDHAILLGADLSGADIRNTKLKNAVLREAILINADLRDANMRGAILEDAKLGGAKLGNANLEGALLWNADLRGANLKCTWLYNTDLKFSLNLSQPQVNSACVNNETRLPEGLKVVPAPPECVCDEPYIIYRGFKS